MTAVLDAILVTGFLLLALLLLAGAVALAIACWRLLSGKRSATPALHDSRRVALDVLQEKYERGEIDRAEYEGRRALLRRER